MSKDAVVKQFVPRLEVVTAIHWVGNNLGEVLAFAGKAKPLQESTDDEYAALVRERGIRLHTPDGVLQMEVGDYVVRSPDGHFYAMKPTVFQAAYEEVSV